MNVSRKISLAIHFVFDQLLPPVIRDSRLFMTLFFRLGLGREAHFFLDFKNKVAAMSDADLLDYYKRSASAHIQRETDLNQACTDIILDEAVGNSVLDIACGRGYLAKLLTRSFQVTGADFVIDSRLKIEHGEIDWVDANIESLEFADNSFDTVVCAHTLEHVVDIQQAIAELRRVTKQKLIVVLPRQRAYQYTSDLHLHFFYYQWQVEMLMKVGSGKATGHCALAGGDWVYIEEKQS